ncbi:7512_t:CDS:1, partial [Paraglomus brasilianum]
YYLSSSRSWFLFALCFPWLEIDQEVDHEIDQKEIDQGEIDQERRE